VIIRTETHFYKQPISKVLLFAIIADITLTISILTIGVPGFIALPIAVTAITLSYFIFCSLIINDWIKVKIN
jgi:hypothetical protein